MFIHRCVATYANVCQEMMPTEERSAIGSIEFSGGYTVKYQKFSKFYICTTGDI